MRLKPGGIRELHWHKEAEWAYMLAGRARITAVDQEGRNFVDDVGVGVGDIWNFPADIPHSIQGLEEGCELLLVFDNGSFSENETFLICDWFAHTPRDVLAKNFGVSESAFANIPLDGDRSRYIFSSALPPALADAAVASPAGTVPDSFSHRFLARAQTVFASSEKARTFDYQAGDRPISTSTPTPWTRSRAPRTSRSSGPQPSGRPTRCRYGRPTRSRCSAPWTRRPTRSPSPRRCGSGIGGSCSACATIAARSPGCARTRRSRSSSSPIATSRSRPAARHASSRSGWRRCPSSPRGP
jgi:hypothetical protein